MLHVHRASSGRRLASALADVLAEPGGDPFSALTVAVPAKGVERWLAQRLSHRLGAADDDGVCANVVFPSPARLLDTALAEISPELATAVGRWRPQAVAWTLVPLLDELPDDAAFAAVRSFLADGASRRFALAAKTARLLAAYGDDRPELILDWAAGVDRCPADLAWQPALWHRLRTVLGPAPAELHAAACERVRAEPDATSLPEQVCVYGLTRITRARLDVLAALAVHREVHLFVQHPGPALWDAVPRPSDGRRRDDADLTHPLLASLSRDVRELQQRLQLAAPDLVTQVHDQPPSTDTLLHRLQRDLRTDTVSASLGAADPSLQVHACHGPARQVEVLRDVVLRLLDADQALEPRDVLVLCPDVETYAPLVTAAFGPTAHPAHQVPVQVADRSPRQTNPLLALAARVLTLAGSRVTGSQVLDLAGSPAVREQFGFEDDDIEQLRGWVVGAQVHWGLSAEHRSTWGLAGLDDGTWRRGLDRLLAGAALGHDQPWHGVLRYDALDGGSLDLLGRTAELLERLAHALGELEKATTAGGLLDALEAAVGELGSAPVDAPWQQVALRRELGALREAAGESPAELADVTALLADVLAGRPTRTSFRTGALTVCTLTPMRSVPHKVVVLLGMDDGAFPRHGLPDGDDLLARDPRLGERDPRSEDRQLLLDAVLAAEQHLVVLYTGAHLRTGTVLAPAVPVGELLDTLGSALAVEVVTRHPLQPFDARAFTGLHSYDPAAHAGAVAARGALVDPPPFLADPVAATAPSAVALQHLVDVVLHPSKAFLRQRLEVTGTSLDEEPTDALPLELDHLAVWALGDRLLQGRLAGTSRAALVATERARGALPPGVIGAEILREVGQCADEIALTAADYVASHREVVDVDLELGRARLVGSVARVHGRDLVTVTYSRLGAKQQLRAWVELLAVAAQRSGPWRAVLVGRAQNSTPRVETYLAPDQDAARRELELLLSVRDAGLQSPLGVPVEAAAAYAQARRQGQDVDAARDAAMKRWASPFGVDGPDRDDQHALIWGREAPFGDLWSWRSPVPLPAVAGGEPTDFARLACRIWFPLLDADEPA